LLAKSTNITPIDKANERRLQGEAHRRTGEFSNAISALDDSVTLLRTIAGASADLASALSCRAAAKYDAGDHAAAETDYQDALRIAETIGDLEGKAIYEGNLAALALNAGEWSKAATYGKDALVLARKIGRKDPRLNGRGYEDALSRLAGARRYGTTRSRSRLPDGSEVFVGFVSFCSTAGVREMSARRWALLQVALALRFFAPFCG
jgi:tetratricopeptide (TPR) repeat protein